jgi:hypothetical protein
MSDVSANDVFRDHELLVEPYAYLDAVRGRCPV